ncbi:hypothetical protein HMPREF3151_07855 [Corynebacterium sp. HMSC05H05]|uniref:Zn-ribbon domain-containing OB-fold protein n=1 Tax=Corynebacterium sp. HMSC05H05 TaxID=1581119 RepID=UPI0008A65184|nr:OB-fold domain-containing protein [Corynebacterium sp. HMSC05H05]OFT57307.1 hypothetical protein HMPREF3151_07855 [Corynebacterium sp. HMSC05H05]
MAENTIEASNDVLMPGAADDPRYQQFFEGLKQKEIRVRQCTQCERWQWPPHDRCFQCQGSDFEWHQMPTSGEVYSFSVMYRAFDPYHQDKLPYGIVIVQLGPVHVTGRFEGDPEDIHCGMPVELVWDDLAVAGHSPVFAAAN